MTAILRGGGERRGIPGDVFIIRVDHRFPRISPGIRDFARLLCHTSDDLGLTARV